MLTTIILVMALLAAVNGANDNIKGAATLLGSGVAGYRTAIALATLATAAGGILSIFLANGLLAAFSGKGIIPAEVTSSLPFLASVGVGAALTVGLATGLGLPISTTHALLGGLVGAGFGAALSEVHAATAFREMLLPLLVSPAMAFILTPLLSRMKVRADAAQVCARPSSAVLATDGKTIVESEPCVTITPVDDPVCSAPMTRQIARVDASVWIDRLHLASAAAVSFTRGLNDTSKIAALMVAAGNLGAFSATTLVVVSMDIGGWRVADMQATSFSGDPTTLPTRCPAASGGPPSRPSTPTHAAANFFV
ncbi:inorganic phosphate transporter [Pandoraea sp. E26]|uniref:inorganic phosphate transporter n=1 Tax=Pandoraea sp. E26 TaxID=1427365 RepID=UPI00068A9F68|nr:inorganic phosphate transporter [Pandoraea sp. E26]